ncbi:MAG: UPF0182 family protein [Phycisphaerae bacterium]
MYSALIIVFIAIAAGVIALAIRKRCVWLGGIGVLIGIGTALFFWLLGFWADMLWFQQLGYGGRFWTSVWAQVLATIGGVLAAALIVGLLTWSLGKKHLIIRGVAVVVAGYIGGQWGHANWQTVLLYINGVDAGVADPILGKDVGFYLFRLPMYESLHAFLAGLAVLALLASLASLFLRVGQNILVSYQADDTNRHHIRPRPLSVYLSMAALLLTVAFGLFLDRYELMYSTWGAVRGAGWTDVHVRLPVYWIMIVLVVLLAITVLLLPMHAGGLQKRLRRQLSERNLSASFIHPATLLLAGGVLAVLWVIILGIVPGLFQWLLVEPNEITYEKPYISHNIEYTRKAFGLEKAEQREFPASKQFSRQTVQQNQALFDNIRLWDYRALMAVYRQFQEIRLYYQFHDVDIDRYTIDGEYRQVMISAREMELSNLPGPSQTFVNRHFKYTHGIGVTLTAVNKFTPEGLPDLLVRDIPPKSTAEGLEIDQPRIYYGELTDTYAVVNSSEQEFDYPSGDQNVYNRYDGTGGVPMGSLWRQFLFGWQFGGTSLLVSEYPQEGTRIMFRRNIRERIKTLAPFLQLDNDPYIVLADGKLYWMVDAYTTTNRYPYSEPFSGSETMDSGAGRPSRRNVLGKFAGKNYIRNSVKVVVDAYEGSVDFYVFDPDDPIIRTWRNIFPDMFKDRQDMPQPLKEHIRYPEDFLLLQGLMYAKYHMTVPEVFYNQEDLWVRATEKYYQWVQPVQPYYIIWQPPDSDRLEYVLIQPFTPKNRQVLIGWIAGMCDDENYGRFLSYQFPKDKRMLGPQQVETKIDQNSFLSGQLSLWDQRGSKVIRGNMLAIPVADTLLYVEPIYLQAETSAYPELRLVVLMHRDNLSYGETFEDALEGLLEGTPSLPGTQPTTGPVRAPDVAEAIRRASRAFSDYQRLTGEGRFQEASQALDRLKNALEELKKLQAQEDNAGR